MTQKSPEKTPKKPLAESTGASLRKRRSKLPADTTVKPARLPDLAPEKGGSPAKPTSIVGIGASAGGFEAFQQLLGQLPADTGLAFVLVQHLDPTHQSKLSELLSRSSPMPVSEVKNGVKVEPN